MTRFLHPLGCHRGLRGGDVVAGERGGIDGRGSGQLGGGRHARWASSAVIESSSRGGARRRRRQRNRCGHRPAGRCRSGHRTELELAHRRGRGYVLCGNGIGRAQGHLRLGRRVAELAANGGWRRENRVQHPNALTRRSAARGQGKIFFSHDGAVGSCPPGDTPDPHAASADGRRSDTRGKGILERQMSGQTISLDGELRQAAQVLDPPRKFA